MTHFARPMADDLILALGEPAERALVVLHRHGLRATAARIAILTVLSASTPGHRTAIEIQDLLGKERGGINTTTVYRTLSTLEELGIVHQLALADGPASYGLTDQPHHHAICTQCSAVTEIPASDLTAVLRAARRDSAFTFADSASIILYGLCDDCQ